MTVYGADAGAGSDMKGWIRYESTEGFIFTHIWVKHKIKPREPKILLLMTSGMFFL